MLLSAFRLPSFPFPNFFSHWSLVVAGKRGMLDDSVLQGRDPQRTLTGRDPSRSPGREDIVLGILDALEKEFGGWKPPPLPEGYLRRRQ
jgi:hypothetical protein